jgi:hypothetical protein
MVTLIPDDDCGSAVGSQGVWAFKLPDMEEVQDGMDGDGNVSLARAF